MNIQLPDFVIESLEAWRLYFGGLRTLHFCETHESHTTLCRLNRRLRPFEAIKVACLVKWPTSKEFGGNYSYCKKCLKDPRIPLILLDSINL